MFEFIFIVLILSVIYVIVSYNKLQSYSQDILESQSNIKVSLNKKINLVNQLTNVVTNYQDHEKLVMLKVSDDHKVSNLSSNYTDTSNRFQMLQGVAERFPEIKADSQYQNLMQQLESIEEGLMERRTNYNKNAKLYNTKLTTFPTILFASKLGFSKAPYLDFDIENPENTQMAEFKTQDNEHLKALLSESKHKLVDTSKKALEEGTDIAKKISKSEQAEKLKDSVQHISKQTKEVAEDLVKQVKSKLDDDSDETKK